MKFKYIFILFSSTLLFLIAVLVLLPLFMLNSSLSTVFWRMNWPFLVILSLALLGFTLFYVIHRKLFILLEKEDWPALARYLEGRMIKTGKYTPRFVRLLANTYLVLSDAAAVMSLENKVAIVKPAIVDANALVFGTARILGGDISGAVRFFNTRKEAVKPSLKDWVQWYYGFSLLLNHQYEESEREFSFLSRVSKDGIIIGLASYFLSENLAYLLSDEKEEILEIANAGKERVLKILPSSKDWNGEVSRFSSEIHAAAIARYIKESAQWIYGRQE